MKHNNNKINDILEKISNYKDRATSLEYLIQDLGYLIKNLKVEDKKFLIEIQSELATIEMIYFYALLEMQRNKEENIQENDIQEIDKSLNSILKIIDFAFNLKKN